MQYLSKHAAAKRIKVRQRLAGVGIAGAATVVAGIATGGAAKASTVWDRVAACESGGNWHINTGNGFYGGLQFTNSTWRGYGGGAFAARADLASKDQQIAVAQRVLAGQGPGAWPVCSVRAGLTRSGGGATSSGLAVSRSQQRTAAPSTSTHKVTKKKTYASSNTQRTYSVAVSGTQITVKSGDTLSKLANSHHVEGGWQRLYAANRDKISNPNLIFVGQVFNLPK